MPNVTKSQCRLAQRFQQQGKFLNYTERALALRVRWAMSACDSIGTRKPQHLHGRKGAKSSGITPKVAEIVEALILSYESVGPSVSRVLRHAWFVHRADIDLAQLKCALIEHLDNSAFAISQEWEASRSRGGMRKSFPGLTAPQRETCRHELASLLSAPTSQHVSHSNISRYYFNMTSSYDADIFIRNVISQVDNRRFDGGAMSEIDNRLNESKLWQDAINDLASIDVIGAAKRWTKQATRQKLDAARDAHLSFVASLKRSSSSGPLNEGESDEIAAITSAMLVERGFLKAVKEYTQIIKSK